MAIPIEKLDELIEEKEEDVVGSESFRIENLKMAIWADEKTKDAEIKLVEIDNLADERIAVLQAKIDKLNEWREEAKKPYMRKIDFFKMHLLMFLNKSIQEQMKSGDKKITKTIELPFRTLRSRAQQPEIIKDDEQLAMWAKDNAEEYVEKIYALNWAEYKKTLRIEEIDGKTVYVDQSGQIVPHITLIPKPDSMDWKVKE